MAGGLRAGDEIEYTVVDSFTRAQRRVVYRVDWVERDKVVFNGGGRVESPNGRVLEDTMQIAGDLDRFAPPGGWGIGFDYNAGHTWKMRFTYANALIGDLQFELESTVKGQASIRTAAGEFRAVHIHHTGYAYSPGADQLRLDIDVWYSPELGRAVRFASNARRTQQGFSRNDSSRESAELSAIRRR